MLHEMFKLSSPKLSNDDDNYNLQVVHDLSNGQEKAYKLRGWTDTDRHIIYKIIIPVAAVVGALGLTLIRANLRVQVIGYIISIAVITAADPINVFENYLSVLSRSMLVLSISCIALSLMFLRFNVWVVTAAIIFLTVLIIKFTNKKLLNDSKFLMTKNVQRILQFDPEKSYSKNWQATGKRETRELLYDLKCYQTEDDINYIYKYIYCLGFLNGSQKEYNNAAALKESRTEVDKLEYQIGQYQDQLEDAKNEIEHLKVMSNLYRGIANKYENEEQLKNKQEQTQENDKVIKFNLPEKTTEEKVIAGLQKGLSYREVAAAVGVSKSTVGNIAKKLK